MPDPLVYFNSSFTPRSRVCVSPDDRGFLFGDGVYEVVRYYGGHPFQMDAHLARLRRSLGELRIEGVDVDGLETVLNRLAAESGHDDAMVYLQITRGAAPRRHSFPPENTPPTIYGFAQECRPEPGLWETGSRAVIVPDLRWGRCDIKSLNLLANVLANQQAVEGDVDEAIFQKDGVITEGSHTNVAAVIDGIVRTHPDGPAILPGVTRGVVLELCRALDIPVDQTPVTVDELLQAEEVMIFSTREEVMPVVEIDGRRIGNGRPGALARRLQQAFRERTPRGQNRRLASSA